jgi:phosphoribosylamine--glycine ligase
MQGDLFDVLHLTAEGRLDELADEAFGWDPRPSVTVVAAAQGYPGGGRRGDQIEGLEAAAERDDVHVFHAGTRRVANRIVTAGGRVLAVTALGDTCSQARDRAYAAMACIRFEGMQVRRDIGWRAIGGAPAAS